MRTSGLKFYRVYLEIVLGQGPSQQLEGDWHTWNTCWHSVIFPSLETRDGSGRPNVSRKISKEPDRRQREIEEGSLTCQGEASG